MPVVPTTSGRQVQSRGVQTSGFQTFDVPQAGQVLANVADQYAAAYGEAKYKANVALSQDAILQLNQRSNERLYNPQTGFYAQQGKNAIGKGQDYISGFDQDMDEIAGSLPDEAARKMFLQQAQAQKLQFSTGVFRHEIGQTNAYEEGQYQATRKLWIQNESDAWNDPQSAILAKNSRMVATARFGAARGWSQERILEEIESDDRRATEMRAKNYATANPDGWLSGNFQNDDSGGMDMRAISIVESGGKHFNADGSILTSPAGAQGKYQLMPDTGKELAAKRGVEYNPTDEEQNALLASDYANQLYGKYGSETLAGAAYNWGMGNVDKLIDTVGDPRKGEISEAAFISKLPAETQGWLSRYRKNKTGMDPLSIYQIDNLANSQIKKQRKLMLEKVEPVINNTMAQLYNGEVPDYIPDQTTIARTYGKDADKIINQLDIAIDNARIFQAIQYMSPAQQQEEMLKVKPQANDPEYALKLDAYGKLSSLLQRSNETIQAQRDMRRFNEALSIGEKLDPSDKSMQKAADYTEIAKNFRINDATTHDGIMQQVAQTGIIPSQVTTQLSAISRARSPEAVRQGAELFNRLYDTDPASVGDMPKDMQGFYLTVKQLTDSGMSSDAAIEQAQNLTYNQTDALKAQLASTQGTKEYKKDRSKAMDSAVSNMAQWFRWDPSADDQTPEAARFRNDYQALYDLNYRTTGGNADAAKKMTNQQVARTWSISEVNGDAKFMKYAPEALYNYGPSGWQAAQWKAEKELLMYGDRKETITTSPTQLGITSGNAPIVETKTPESRIGGELEITPDVLTSRQGDYAIMVRAKDKDGIEAVQPFYDKHGRPMRWKPSLEEWEPYKKMQQEREQRDYDEIMRGQAIRGFKDKHRALDEQYKRLHNERINSVPNFIYGGGTN
ncbi:transglycosylase SLT domain-containing protein [Citrobacter amalonaticus]|uniref:transglycosylase SLT domain-containing protein n=1 Tax=Citrobacter amalonaticus TaxID=35703 RepID=UPI001A184C62|nr:transglycosylase SLT domain-containing protein [Citrobacter amalonaticus]HDQ2811545.1 transglycosylase SLT domain-containing protein [Citrobacter amalonaticus]